MKRIMTAAVAAAAVGLCGAAAQAESLKIGFLATLSGPPAVLGQHMRDGFLLGVKQAGGKLGGLDTEVIVVDDELKPDGALTKVRGLLERDEVDMMAGVVFSNVMMAVYKPIIDSETIFVGANAGPSPIAGRACSPYFFTTSYQNDQNHEAMGKYAEDAGYKRMIVMAPNYQAGKDSIAGFKRHFKGEIVDELYTKLGQLDFSSEITRIAAAKPDAIFTFMPGGMGVNLVKQYKQAGLAGQIPFLSAFTVDETTLPATKDAALGLQGGAQWAPNIDNAANKAFVEAFEVEYGYPPATYAAQGYDAARLIDAALAKAGGTGDKQALMAALKEAPFDSVRGDFSYNTNNFPIQDVYVVEAVKRDDGKYVTQTVEKVFEDKVDAYVEQCRMN
ncbi:ABC transporter substrate-binding protein [Stappia sp. ES.058]|uniref:ABC transporter substrate-binding protein n=1 Tax=Stappia sp. ES.058 TaxID=1881061 RepID=UPI00087BF624|nr:ABC transporter substrate-binding protein [Stappia sp. ES.058]SDT99737.1 amino acid/amide ABC transporter substrate-binding protein, HAAT family [Stappia sp. ES.058]